MHIRHKVECLQIAAGKMPHPDVVGSLNYEMYIYKKIIILLLDTQIIKKSLYMLIDKHEPCNKKL